MVHPEQDNTCGAKEPGSGQHYTFVKNVALPTFLRSEPVLAFGELTSDEFAKQYETMVKNGQKTLIRFTLMKLVLTME